jgi:hypothetical protein
MRRQPEIQGLLVPLLGLLLAACPEQLGQQCPPQSVALGQYALSRAGRHPAGECVATQADGGGSPAPLALDDGGVLGATICLGSGSDGGPQLQLVVPGKQPRPSDLLPDGGFHFTSHTSETGTACVCSVVIDEIFDGFLQTTPLGPVALQPDGGLPRITGITGSLTDARSADTGATGCLCNLPCPITYSISGTRF